MNIPHRCGAVKEYCKIDDNKILYFCSFCRVVIEYEQHGVKYLKPENYETYGKKEYSEDIIDELK